MGGSRGGLATDLGVALACGAAARGADVRGAVSRFLAALPLGATAADAEVEAAVGGALTAALLARADLQRKLGAWRAPPAPALHRAGPARRRQRVLAARAGCAAARVGQ